MNIRKSAGPGHLGFSLALLASFLAMAPYSAARSSNQSSSTEKINVVGHLNLQGIQVKRMIPQQHGAKYYLYLHRANKNAFAIVDVTNPRKPALIDRSAMKESSGGTVDVPGTSSVFGIAFAPDKGQSSAAASTAPLPTESVRLLDLTDPKHAKTIKTFDGVTSVATDDGRKLVFIANDEGLWIVSHHQNRPLPLCTSESALIPEPDCQ